MTTAFGSAIAVIGTHVAASGTAVTPQILDVAEGAPVSVNARTARYWYAGTGPAPHYPGSQTMTTRMVGQRVTVAVYWPITDKAVLAGLNAEIQAMQDELFRRLLGDSQLGGTCDDMDVGEAEVDYPVVNGAQTAELTIPLTLDFGEAYTISA